MNSKSKLKHQNSKGLTMTMKISNPINTKLSLSKTTSRIIKQSAIAAFFITTLLSQQAQAHSRWILPTHFSMSSESGEWLMFDITASNEVFNVDKAMGAKNISILTPNNKVEKAASTFKGKRKSVANYYVEGSGTFKITNNAEPSYFSSYKVGEKRERFRGNKAELKAKLPANATDIKTRFGLARIETYVTMNNPSDNFGLDGKFLELAPITHPSEIVEGEEFRFKLLFNGKPQADVVVEITMDNARYRNDPLTVKLKTDKSGELSFTPAQAGRYLLVAEYQQPALNKALADVETGEVFLTFEAQLN